MYTKKTHYDSGLGEKQGHSGLQVKGTGASISHISLIYKKDAEGRIRLQVGGSSISSNEEIVAGTEDTFALSMQIGEQITIPGVNTEGFIVDRVALVSPHILNINDVAEVCRDGFLEGNSAYALGFCPIAQNLERRREWGIDSSPDRALKRGQAQEI